MIVTLDFVCLRLNPRTTVPEVMLQTREKEPEMGRDALVGGWIWEDAKDGGAYDEDLNQAVDRILSQKVGIRPTYIERAKPEGSVFRDPTLGWSVTLPHLCLFNRTDTEVLEERPGISWISVQDVLEGACELPFDHKNLVRSAFEVFLNKVRYSSILLYLLPQDVTIPEIVEAYKTLGVQVSKQTIFSRWVNSGLLTETGQHKETGTRGKSPMLYRLNESTLSYFDSEIGKTYRAKD